MQVKFIIPKFGCHEKPSGVYKIVFDDTHFYIGSSSKLKVRFSLWRNAMKRGTNKNRKIRELFQTTSKVEFIVLELLPKEKCKEREGYYIQTHWEDPLLLNYCPNPESCYGIRFTEKDLLLRKKPSIKEKKRPIAIFDKSGQEVARFKYVSEAATFLKVKRDSVLGFLLGHTNYIQNHRLKEIKRRGVLKEPPPFIPKPHQPRKKGYKHSDQARANKKRLYHKALTEGKINLPAHTKAIVQRDANGSIIQEYRSINEAAAKYGGSTAKKAIQKVLNRWPHRKYKGFHWRIKTD